jgi:hypothetical protein
MSMGQLTNKGIVVVYDKGVCRLYSKKGEGKLITVGIKDGQLCRMQLKMEMLKCQANVVIARDNGKSTFKRWHD